MNIPIEIDGKRFTVAPEVLMHIADLKQQIATLTKAAEIAQKAEPARPFKTK